jgi:aspartokinase-like uncharacterized kinase
VAIDCVIKVGGSLYDLPDLAGRLRDFLKSVAGRPYLLVPGGGTTVDVIRELDTCHRLGEERSHWLALRAMTFNAHFLANLLGNSLVIPDATSALEAWQAGTVPILDAYAFALADREHVDQVPHCWQATSDAIAGRVARVMKARALVLLKSVTVPDPLDVEQAVRDGHVDACLPGVLGGAVHVRIENLRQLSLIARSQGLPSD